VLAPADGVVVNARNDVPDNGPDVAPESVFSKLSDPIQASAGNSVVISHGNSEFSVMMHMQKGSVRVTKGQSVKRGDVIGLIGSSGDSFGPHLHFQVQTGPDLFRYPSVPVVFENLKGKPLARGVYFSPK
jgi:murein DD-endopeptidase MepM/ murein hydrolase activator NlpD